MINWELNKLISRKKIDESNWNKHFDIIKKQYSTIMIEIAEYLVKNGCKDDKRTYTG